MQILASIAASLDHMEIFSIDDDWGIGAKYALSLNAMGIFTAKQLKDAYQGRIGRQLTMNGARTVLELKGVVCFPLETQVKPKKGIASATAFGRPIESLDELSQAIATYTARTAEKLRH